MRWEFTVGAWHSVGALFAQQKMICRMPRPYLQHHTDRLQPSCAIIERRSPLF
ncbi:MAG: hypothetical protein HY785_23035 [Oscillatoriophycideae cyanobacterium NC_groundwater_1537_Pr4_S-0.65um_50_18]|nr:hypothetical protein [Oscillatoriophycideae cyanobacterium NC_groundwater_1537_Pr4_S-0.65um_50_18]